MQPKLIGVAVFSSNHSLYGFNASRFQKKSFWIFWYFWFLLKYSKEPNKRYPDIQRILGYHFILKLIPPIGLEKRSLDHRKSFQRVT